MLRAEPLAIVVLVSACTLTHPLDSYGPSKDAGTAAPFDAGPTDGGAGCPTGMVRAESFCIDAHEVTQADYQAAVMKLDLAVLPPECAFKTSMSFVPGAGGPKTGCDANDFAPDKRPKFPVVCVDFCDAFAYCALAGKRVCGAIGGGRGRFGSAIDPTSSQWFAACSAAGKHAYPYGDTYDATACNGIDKGGNLVDTASIPACQGGYPGLFDMSGNVYEWEDACTVEQGKTACHVRGGAASSTSDKLRCDGGANVNTESVDTRVNNIGFRCCKD